MRREPSLVERLVAEKAELEKRERLIEDFRLTIRMNHEPLRVEEPMPELKRFLWRVASGRQPALTPVPSGIVDEFYGYLNNRLDAARRRLLQIDNELDSRSKTDMKEN